MTDFSLCSLSGPVGSDRRGGRSPPGDELVAFRFCHGLHHRGWADARLPHRLHHPLHSSRYEKSTFNTVDSAISQLGMNKVYLIMCIQHVSYMVSGDLDVMRRSDVVFWATFCCIMITVPLFFLRWPREVTDVTTQPTHYSTYSAGVLHCGATCC